MSFLMHGMAHVRPSLPKAGYPSTQVAVLAKAAIFVNGNSMIISL